jgi:hypothetical protein
MSLEQTTTSIHFYCDEYGRERVRLVSSDGNHPTELQDAIEKHVGIYNYSISKLIKMMVDFFSN